MKLLQPLIFLSFFSGGTTAFAQESSRVNLEAKTFYLVRHGEKDTGSNPVLSQSGNARAGDLYRLLKDKKINKIYFTQYRRTMLTGDSLRIYEKTDTVQYKADVTGDDLLKKLSVDAAKKENILVIGHSNTIPAIIRKLGAEFDLKDIPDNEYDNLYVLSFKNGEAVVKRMKYGKASVPPKANIPMVPLQ